jgi:hypothetical protein
LNIKTAVLRHYALTQAKNFILLTHQNRFILSVYILQKIKGLKSVGTYRRRAEKAWEMLRFYYGYTDASCGIAAFDNLATGESIRFEPKSNAEIDDAKAKLRHDIRAIVRAAEEESSHTCEICGAEGKLRNDSDLGIHWVRTLCDSCHEDRIKKAIEAREKRKKMDDNS